MSDRWMLMKGLPRSVDVYEVGPRDGLQNEARPIGTEDKVRLIEALVAAGTRRIEVTSFVSPKWIPQLADAEAVLARVKKPAGVRFSALVPNLQGFHRTEGTPLDEVGIFLSATETHSRKNINKTIEEALTSAQEVATAAQSRKLRARGYLSCVWGCPYEGEVSIARVVDIARRLTDFGIYELSLGDTIGVGTPAQTLRVLEALLVHLKPAQIALHLHDTRGTALANALVGLHLGIATLDSSIGGLGGCPYAPGAAGNLATEDLVFMLQGLGLETGIDLKRLVDAGELAQTMVGRKLPGKYLQAALGEREKQAQQQPAQT